jgi:hypothetical protein
VPGGHGAHRLEDGAHLGVLVAVDGGEVAGDRRSITDRNAYLVARLTKAAHPPHQASAIGDCRKALRFTLENEASMADKWDNISFTVSDRLLRCYVEFHDGTPAKRLTAKQAAAKVFHEISTGKRFDARQMISNLLRITKTRKQDLMRPAAVAEAYEKGVAVGKPSIDMDFSKGSVDLVLAKKGEDIKRVVFDLELTVRLKKSS